MSGKNSLNNSSSSSLQKNEKLSLSGNVLKMKFMQRKSKSLGASPSASSAIIKDNNFSSNNINSKDVSFSDTKLPLNYSKDIIDEVRDLPKPLNNVYDIDFNI